MSDKPINAKTGNTNSPTAAERLAMLHPRLCTAHKTNGEPCARYAIRGGNVCGVHGGKAKQVQRKAKQRLDFAKDMMLVRAVNGIPEPPPSQPNPRPPEPEPAEPEPEAELPPARTGEVWQITKAQHEAMKRGELPADEHTARAAPVTPKPAKPAGPPPWAEPHPAALTRQLTTEEDALAAVAPVNRAVRGSQRRHRRR